MSWYLYLIECADGSVYTGITTDVAARFSQHAQGKGARYTRARKPRAVLASFELADRSSASRAEYWVKRLTPTQKRALAGGSLSLASVLQAPDAGATRRADGDCATPAPAAGIAETATAEAATAIGAAMTTGGTATADRAAKPKKPKKAPNAAKISKQTATGSSGAPTTSGRRAEPARARSARAAAPQRTRTKQNRAAS
ncbi:excinuclease [Burkholderia sp. MSMB617WGS]|uniref:GIY-YIG nuclease family protein n=1 Tax=Burkholderia TaxID=32008 RepID=UPI0007600C08|nr:MULTISPECIES: GIY-YIG nuclease family protein [Burkholderia]AOK47758.1 excinuclease [Burkholderia sp. MSMB617WGS]KWZ41049.1 excinuclease [Burkholderia savannae]